MEGLVRIIENCVICGFRFENTDGLGRCCSDKCWSVYEENQEDENEDEE